MIYLNNAATTYPKPKTVLASVLNCLTNVPVGQYRSDFLPEEDVVNRCRQNLAKLFNIKTPERIYFTSGATEALNMVLMGLPFKGKHVITTVTEHNSVLRPLANRLRPLLKRKEACITFIKCNAGGKILPQDLKRSIRANTVAVIINHCSNVTGIVQNIEEIGYITREKGIMLIVDAAQSAGCVELDVEKQKINILIFAGHKGLFGMQGTGGFYLDKNIALTPTKFGGDGKNSRR